MQAERNGLHADVFPFLAEVCRALGLLFEPSDMVSGGEGLLFLRLYLFGVTYSPFRMALPS